MKFSGLYSFLSLTAIASVAGSEHYNKNPEYEYGNYQPQIQTVTVTVSQPASTVYINQCTTEAPAPSYEVPKETTTQPQTPPPQETSPPSGDNEMICRVNAVRAKAGKKPLYVDNCLMKSAHDHSQEQAKNKKMTHSGFDGKTKELGGRLTLSGYTWNSCAENIAWNQQTIKQVVDDWTKSKGHYANMIGDYDCFGWGEVDKYWTQNFASGKKCTSTTLPQCNGY